MQDTTIRRKLGSGTLFGAMRRLDASSIPTTLKFPSGIFDSKFLSASSPRAFMSLPSLFASTAIWPSSASRPPHASGQDTRSTRPSSIESPVASSRALPLQARRMRPILCLLGLSRLFCGTSIHRPHPCGTGTSSTAASSTLAKLLKFRPPRFLAHLLTLKPPTRHHSILALAPGS